MNTDTHSLTHARTYTCTHAHIHTRHATHCVCVNIQDFAGGHFAGGLSPSSVMHSNAVSLVCQRTQVCGWSFGALLSWFPVVGVRTALTFLYLTWQACHSCVGVCKCVCACVCVCVCFNVCVCACVCACVCF